MVVAVTLIVDSNPGTEAAVRRSNYVGFDSALTGVPTDVLGARQPRDLDIVGDVRLAELVPLLDSACLLIARYCGGAPIEP